MIPDLGIREIWSRRSPRPAMIPDLGIREIWDSDTIIFRCGCHMLRWPWKDGRRAVRLDGCGRYEHYDDALALVDPLDLRWTDKESLMICYDEREIPGELIFVH